MSDIVTGSEAATEATWDDVREALRYLGVRSAAIDEPGLPEPRVSLTLSDLRSVLDEIPKSRW